MSVKITLKKSNENLPVLEGPGPEGSAQTGAAVLRLRGLLEVLQLRTFVKISISLVKEFRQKLKTYEVDYTREEESAPPGHRSAWQRWTLGRRVVRASPRVWYGHDAPTKNIRHRRIKIRKVRKRLTGGSNDTGVGTGSMRSGCSSSSSWKRVKSPRYGMYQASQSESEKSVGWCKAINCARRRARPSSNSRDWPAAESAFKNSS